MPWLNTLTPPISVELDSCTSGPQIFVLFCVPCSFLFLGISACTKVPISGLSPDRWGRSKVRVVVYLVIIELYNIHCIYTVYYIHFIQPNKGRVRKKKTGKILVFSQTPPGPPPPPPVWHFFRAKNLPPFFLLKIASLMAETNFTLGPTSKTNKFPVLMVIICPELAWFK